MKPGDRIVSLLYNQAEWAICFWAAAYAGCVFVPLDPRSMARREESSHLLGTAKASAFVVATSQIATAVVDVLDREVKVGMVVDSSNGVTPKGWSTLDVEDKPDRQRNCTTDEHSGRLGSSDHVLHQWNQRLAKSLPPKLNQHRNACPRSRKAHRRRSDQLCLPASTQLPRLQRRTVVISVAQWWPRGLSRAYLRSGREHQGHRIESKSQRAVRTIDATCYFQSAKSPSSITFAPLHYHGRCTAIITGDGACEESETYMARHGLWSQ